MSAAPLKSGVAETPDKKTVTTATDPKAKAADVNRKMKFYGVLQAFREGRYPDNKQIDETLTYVLNNSPVDVSKLSPEGQSLIEDTRAIINDARKLVLEKNKNEEFQNFLYATRKADVKGATGVTAPVAAEDAKKDAETAGEALRTLVKLFLRNGEFRKLINDAGLIGRDMFADGASFAANKARPNEEQLATVDHPAPDGEFHDDIPEGLKKVANAVQKKDDVVADASRQAQAAASAIDPNASAEANKKRVAAAIDGNGLQVPEKHKEVVKEHVEATKNYLNERFDDNRRKQWIFRLKKVLVEVQKHPDYADAMDFFIAAFENYKGHAVNLHEQVENNAKSLRGEGNIATAEQSFRTLIERFANGKSSQPMFDALDAIYTDIKNDPELHAYFKDIDAFARKCVSTAGYVLRDECDEQARTIINKGKKFFGSVDGQDSKYKGHFLTFFDRVEEFFLAFGDDPANKAFGEKWHKLGKDLFLNSEGKVTPKPALLADIGQVILPALAQHAGYVPIPRIEYSDPSVDLVLENISIDAQNLLPNVIQLENRNFFKASPYAQKISNIVESSATLTLSQIQTDMRDVRFYIKSKSGFKTEQHGIADLLLTGKGLTATVGLKGSARTDRQRNPHVFEVTSVKIKIDGLDFAIRGSKHDTAIKILRPLAKSIAKKAIAKAAEGGIRDALEKLDRHLVELRDAADTEAVLKAKKAEAEKKARENAPKGTFKVPSSKRTSVLPNVGFGGDSWLESLEKANKEAAAKNGSKDWHSPAFNIVNGRA